MSSALPEASIPSHFVAPKRRRDRIALLRDIARRLRRAPDAEETLQFVLDATSSCVGADAGLLTLHVPSQKRFSTGTALGAGPRLDTPLKADNALVGDFLLTRMAGGEDFAEEDESFVELVGEYIARAATGVGEQTAMDPGEREFVNTVVSHVRQPLATVAQMVETVLLGQGGMVSESQRVYLEQAGEHARRLHRFSEDLVLLSRLRPPRTSELEVVAFGPWIAQSIDTYKVWADRAGVTVEVELPEEPLLVRISTEQFRHVLRHLLDNAIKFSPKGETVVVSTSKSDGVVRMTVADRGEGMEGKEAPKMFERFARHPDAETRGLAGGGLGLAIVHEIVEGHGGRSWIDTAPGQGLRACVSLMDAS